MTFVGLKVFGEEFSGVETDMSVNMGVVGSGEHELSFDLVM